VHHEYGTKAAVAEFSRCHAQRYGKLTGVADTELNRLAFETIEHDFVVDQVSAYLAAGVEVFHPMPEARMALRLSGAMKLDTGFIIAFADANLPPKSVDAPDPLDIYILRP
jgi:hypothetical protein